MTAKNPAELAAAMTDEEAALILTLTDEPELILAPGQVAPRFAPVIIAAARLRSDWACADLRPHAVH
jgi:hypothetical protein